MILFIEHVCSLTHKGKANFQNLQEDTVPLIWHAQSRILIMDLYKDFGIKHNDAAQVVQILWGTLHWLKKDSVPVSEKYA